MVVPRGSNYSSVFRAHAYRAARSRAAGQSWRHSGRRFYASGHHEGSKKASSDLPWLIGSVAVTVPSATWLWQQGPKKSVHSGVHGHGEHEKHEQNQEHVKPEEHDEHEEHEVTEAHEANEANEEQKENEGGQGNEESDGKEEDEENGSKEVKDERPEDTGEEKPRDFAAPIPKSGEKDEEVDGEDTRPIGETLRNEPPNEISPRENKRSSGDEGLKEGPNEPLQKKSQVTKSIDPDADDGIKDTPSDDIDINHEGEQKGSRISEGDKQRQKEDPRTNSMHPYMADERKSKKAEGVVDSAKITGTVDVNRPLRK